MSTTAKSTHTVNVTGFSETTTETKIHDFFSFCGRIKSIDFHHKEEPRSAHVHFEKPSAARTALMLNGGTLDHAQLTVTSDVVHQDEEKDDEAPIDQTDKPRAGIVAEYLAKGYMLHDNILQRAIDMDNKQGISKRFVRYFSNLDSTLGARALGPEQTISGKIQSQITAATQQAKSIDQQKGYSKMAQDYYSKALASPLGQKVLEFYTSTSKQVVDIHEEARRISTLHKTPQPATSESQPAATSEPAAATTQPEAPAATTSEKAPETETKA